MTAARLKTAGLCSALAGPFDVALAGGAGLAAVAVVFLAARRLTDDRQRLRLDRLVNAVRGG